MHHCCCVVENNTFSLFSVSSPGWCVFNFALYRSESFDVFGQSRKIIFNHRKFIFIWFFFVSFRCLITFAKLSSRKNSPFKEDPASSISTVPGSSSKKHRSRSTSRYVEEKPKKKKAVGNVSLVSIPNTIRLSVLNSGLFPICKLECFKIINFFFLCVQLKVFFFVGLKFFLALGLNTYDFSSGRPKNHRWSMLLLCDVIYLI